MTTSNSSLSRPLTFSRDHQGIREITGLRLPKLRINRDAYENFRDTHKVESKVDYSLFEEYQKRKLKRGERDLADRCATLCTAYGCFITQLTSFKLQDAYATE